MVFSGAGAVAIQPTAPDVLVRMSMGLLTSKLWIGLATQRYGDLYFPLSTPNEFESDEMTEKNHRLEQIAIDAMNALADLYMDEENPIRIDHIKKV